MKKASAAILSATLLLSACGGGHGISNASSSPPTPTASFSPTSTIAPTPSPSPTPIPTSSKQPEPSADVTMKKEYHMNKNYDIVPNDANGNKKVVLLSFDDGPKDKEMNQALIDILSKHKAKAIFFLNGYRIKQKPELVKLLHDSSQIIGNHSWDHIDLKKESNDKVNQQIDDVQKILKELTGSEPQFFRPPYGSGSDYLKEKIKSDGMLYMTWSNGSLDWEMTVKKNDPNKVIENVLSQLHFGSNILMHELPWTVNALDSLLTQLEEKGYSFVDPRSIELVVR